MATYSTIAADVEADKPLLSRDIKVNAKTLIGGAAIAAFVLGALAATAVTSSPGLRGADFHSSVERVQIKTASDHTMCIAVQGGKAEKKAKLVYEPCTTKTPGQVFEYDEKNSQIRYDGMCVDFLGGGSATAGNNFGLYKCKKQCGNQPVRQAGLEVLFINLAASMQHESDCRPRTKRLRLIHPNV